MQNLNDGAAVKICSSMQGIVGYMSMLTLLAMHTRVRLKTSDISSMLQGLVHQDRLGAQCHTVQRQWL